MLRTFSAAVKVPLRRCLHTSPRSTAVTRPSRTGAIVAGSAVVGTYLAWKTLHGDKVALDSVAAPPKHAAAGAHAEDAASAQETLSDEASIEESLTGSADLLEQAEEESESSGGAFNPATGEINWDCPCLGGMAHGPCGMQFREAFSCFVFSEKDPKGIDCVEKFKAMQDCFREHPDVYGEDIMDDDDDEEPGPPGDSLDDGRAAHSISESQTEQSMETSSTSAA